MSNRRCVICGSNMNSNIANYVCPICGHKALLCETDNTHSTGMEYECCPLCGGKLEMSMSGSVKECSNCGYKIITYTGDAPNYNNYCPEINSLVNEPNNKPMLFGWVCPKCGAVLSPWTDCCPNCTQRNWEITCGTGGNNL